MSRTNYDLNDLFRALRDGTSSIEISSGVTIDIPRELFGELSNLVHFYSEYQKRIVSEDYNRQLESSEIKSAKEIRLDINLTSSREIKYLGELELLGLLKIDILNPADSGKSRITLTSLGEHILNEECGNLDKILTINFGI